MDGLWGIDAGMKTVSAMRITEQGLSAYTLSGTDGGLDPEGLLLPYHEPFIHSSEDRIQSVFSPLFLAIASLGWRAGNEFGVRFLSFTGGLLTIWIGALLLGQMSRQETDSINPGVVINLNLITLSIISTPLIFYMYAIWEHALFTALALTIVYCRLKDSKWLILSGIIAAVGVALRPEGLIWAFVLLLINRRGMIKYGISFLAGVLVFAWFQYFVTGSWLPLQWLANATYADFSFQAVIRNWTSMFTAGNIQGGLLWIFPIAALFWAAFRWNSRYSKIVGWILVVVYCILVVDRVFIGIRIGMISLSSGWLAVSPFAVIWWVLPNDTRVERAIKQVVAAFVVISVLSNPVPVGIHWGPRILLPAMVISAIMVFVHFSSFTAFRKKIAISLLVISIILQVPSLIKQSEIRTDNSTLRSTIEAIDNEPIVVAAWYFGGDLGPSIRNRIVLDPMNEGGWEYLLQAFEQAGIESFYWLIPGSAYDYDLSRGFVLPLRSIEEDIMMGERWMLFHYEIMDQNNEQPSETE